MSKKTKKEPTLEEKEKAVRAWLGSSFVSMGAVCDQLYGLSDGTFDARMPIAGLEDPDSILYTVDRINQALCVKGEIDELFNVLTVLYAVKKEVRLDFDPSGCLTGYDEAAADETFHILHNATLAIMGKDYRWRDVSGIYRMVSTLRRKDFLEYYPLFIESVRLQCKALSGGTVAMPRPFIAKTIGDIVRAHGCKTVFNPFSGAGALVEGLDADMSYTGQESYGVYSIFSRVLADAYGMENVTFTIGNPQAQWPEEQYDAVIFNLPTDCYFDDFEKYCRKGNAYNDLHKDIFETLLSKRTARKVAVGLVYFRFLNACFFEDLRRRLVEEGLLESVICLPEEEVFSDSKIKTAIIVLDFEKRHATVDFYRGEFAVLSNFSGYQIIRSGMFNIMEETDIFRKGVPKEVIEYFDWSYVAALYANPIPVGEGEERVRLTEVGSLLPIREPKRKRALVIRWESFRSDVLRVLSARGEYESAEVKYSEPSEVTGPCVLFRVSREGKVEAFMVREGEKGVYESYNVYALRPDPGKITLEYLTYQLLTCPGLAHFLTDNLEYCVDSRMSRKAVGSAYIPVNPDLGAQKQQINKLMKEYFLAQKRRYNVIWASPLWTPRKDPESEAEMAALRQGASQFGVEIISTPLSAKELAEVLRRRVDECSSAADRADAVVLDARLSMGEDGEEPFDGLDYAIELKDRYEGKRIPFYLFTKASFEEMSGGGIKRRRLEYFKDRYFHDAGAGSVPALCLRLRDEMDAIGSWESRMRSRYEQVFRAADRYNQGGIQRVLSEALDEEFSLELSLKDTEDKFNKLRQLTEDILGSMAERGILPPMNFGAQVDFLVNGRFDDLRGGKGVYYHASRRLMSETLCKALDYFRELVSGGSHMGGGVLPVVEYVSTEVRNSDLYKSALYVFMDFLLWYDRVMEQAEKDPGSVVRQFETVPRGMPVQGVVEQDENGDLICGHTRLQTVKGSTLRVGDTVRINRSTVDWKKATDTVWFYATVRDYELLEEPSSDR